MLTNSKEDRLKPVLLKSNCPWESRGSWEIFNLPGRNLVAGDLLRNLRLGCAVSVGLGIADGHGRDGRSSALDVRQRADLHNFLRRLLQHQLLVNLADAGFFLQE